MVTDQQTNKPKGYAFIEYLNTRDMKGARNLRVMLFSVPISFFADIHLGVLL